MWSDFFDNNIFISKLYNNIPNIINIRILTIKILDEGNIVRIIFDMPRYADNPPEKWKNFSYNTVSVELDFFEIEELKILSQSQLYAGSMEITKDIEGLICVNITGTVEVIIKAHYGMIQKIDAYQKDI